MYIHVWNVECIALHYTLPYLYAMLHDFGNSALYFDSKPIILSGGFAILAKSSLCDFPNTAEYEVSDVHAHRQAVVGCWN